VKRSASKRAGLFLVALSMRLIAAPAMNSPERSAAEAQGSASVSEESAASDKENPQPVKPSREARTRGPEISLLIGVGVLPLASYAYDTRVSIPGLAQLRYSGRQHSLALGFFAGGALTLPGPLRRITVGAGINGSEPDSTFRVIPAGVSPPFSKQSLYSDIQATYSLRSSWEAAFSPFIEHDVGFFHGGQVRAGYQYWYQLGAYSGSFASADGRSTINYNVQLNLRSHLFRISMNDYGALEDDTGSSQRSKRRFGIIPQWGIMIGTHQTIAVFVAIGYSWQIAP
jgi:hypothetical protein